MDKLEKLKRKSVIPGETVTLPSLGMIYGKGVLADNVINGEVQLFPMRLYDEINTRSVDKLLQGTAVSETIQNCCPDILDAGKLSNFDMDYILLHLRRITYGPTMDITFTCTNPEHYHGDDDTPKPCRHENNVSIPLNQFINRTKFMDKDIFIDFDKTRTLTLPLTQYVIKFRHLTLEGFIAHNQLYHKLSSQYNVSNTTELPTGEQHNLTLLSLSRHIESIDDVENNTPENSDAIFEVIKSLTLPDIKAIYEVFANNSLVNYGTTFEYKVLCEECDHENELASQLNPVMFFMQP